MAKIDCSVTVDFIRESKRMCEYYRHDCDSCPMSIMNNGYDRLCAEFIKQHPDKAVGIIQKWSDEHLVKTRLDDLLEKYPNAQLDKEEGCPNLRPAELGYCEHCYSCTIRIRTYKNCWNEPLVGGATGKAVE